MKREIAINASALEVRVALLEDNELAEFFLERNRQVGRRAILKGKVTRVLPGMQAAFVDIGLEKAGFLHVSDFHDGVFRAQHGGRSARRRRCRDRAGRRQ